MKIGNRDIGLKKPPLVIAEMSGNHNQSLEKALEIVDAAALTGAHALKLQTYTADTITLDIKTDEFFISDENSLWKGQSLYELYEQAHTPWEWHEPIMKRANELGLLCFSTPFDASSVEFLETLNVPAYKIASFECLHFPLIKKVIKTKKPILISTGLCSLKEINELVTFLKKNSCKKFALLKCTSSYPANNKDLNLSTIRDMRKKFNCEIGYSDHSIGFNASIGAIHQGASFIEKHVCLNKKIGIDSKFSLEVKDLLL